MAESNPEAVGAQTLSVAVDFREAIRNVVEENQPMCAVAVLAHVRQARIQDIIDPRPSFAEAEAIVADSLYERLEIQRRKYDTVAQVDGASFLLVIRTLADAPILNTRLNQISQFLAEPHPLWSGAVRVPVYMGAAIRQPNEPADTVNERIRGALQQAQATNRGHVLMM